MSDARRFALRFFNPKRPDLWKEVAKLIALAIGLFWFQDLISTSELDTSQQWVLILLLLAVYFWVTEVVPPFAVGLFILGFLVFTLGTPALNDHPQDVMRYVNTWSSPVIWLFLGSFFLGASLQKTGLDFTVFQLAMSRFGNRTHTVFLGIMLVTGTLSALMSNTSTSAMMIAAVMPVIKKLEQPKLGKAILLGIAVSASIGGMATIIGSPPNAIAVEAAASMGHEITFSEWYLFGLPIAVIIILFYWWVAIQVYQIKNDTLSLAITPTIVNASKRDKNVTIFIVIATLVLWLTSALHGIKVGWISMLPIIGLTMTGVITNKDVRALPWDTLLLVAGGLALGEAISHTGLATYFIRQMDFLNTIQSEFFILLSLCYLGVIMSNFMSNTATAALLIPVGMAAFPDYGYQIAISLGLSVASALLLPVSTPPNAIVYATGYVSQKDFRIPGLIVGLFAPFLVVTVVWLLF